jgi:hypothetical protein
MHANDLVNVFRRDVTTNFTTSELVSLANYYAGLDPKAISSAQVPYTGDKYLADGGDALVPDESAKTRLVQNMLVAPPAPAPSPDAMALASIPPATLRVDVQNGSGIPGAARRVADKLRRAGYTIGDVGDAPTDDHATTEIFEHSKITFAGAKVRSSLPPALANIPVDDQVDPSKSDVTIVVGKDLAAALTARPSLSSTSP